MASKLINLKALDDLYRLTKIAIDARDDTENKVNMVDLAEGEAYEVLMEADNVMAGLFGEEWRTKVAVLASALSGLAFNYASEQMNMEVVGTFDEDQSIAFFGAAKITSQLSFLVGFAMALKSAGLWEKLVEERSNIGKGGTE